MNAFTRVVSEATGGREAEGVAPGPMRVGRGMQPPQAEGRAEDDAAVRLASTAYKTATGHTPDRRQKLQLGTAAHYAFSAALGVSYVLLARRFPVLRRGLGSLYGGLIWATADEAVIPALGLSRGPRQQSAGMHAYSLFGHIIYGAALESIRRAATRARM